MAGTLLVCAGPIGNLGDAPPRLAEALESADVVYAEDTRRSRVLLDRLGVSARMRSYFAGNEERREAEIADRLAAGETVAVITDAGTPGISDPGLTAVRAAISVGAAVTGVPGPSAVTFALAVSGLPADRFVFEGFLPRRGGERRRRLEALAAEERTVVVFCAAPRLAADLADLAAAGLAERDCVVLREMTKLHEEVWRGTVAGAVDHWGGIDALGEVTVVVGPARPAAADLPEAASRVATLVAEGASRSAAARQVAEETGLARSVVYDASLRAD